MVLTLDDLQTVLDLLREAADRAGSGAALDVRYRRALKAMKSAKGSAQRARRFTDAMLGQTTRPGPKQRRTPLQVIQTYLALTTGVIRSMDSMVTAAWHGKTYADYNLKPPPIIQCLRDSYLEHGMEPPERYAPTEELHLPLCRRDAITVVAQHFAWPNKDSCIKYLERNGVAGLPGDSTR